MADGEKKWWDSILPVSLSPLQKKVKNVVLNSTEPLSNGEVAKIIGAREAGTKIRPSTVRVAVKRINDKAGAEIIVNTNLDGSNNGGGLIDALKLPVNEED